MHQSPRSGHHMGKLGRWPIATVLPLHSGGRRQPPSSLQAGAHGSACGPKLRPRGEDPCQWAMGRTHLSAKQHHHGFQVQRHWVITTFRASDLEPHIAHGLHIARGHLHNHVLVAGHEVPHARTCGGRCYVLVDVSLGYGWLHAKVGKAKG